MIPSRPSRRARSPRLSRIGIGLAVALAVSSVALAQPHASDALLAVESNRAGIVESVVERFGAQVEALGFSSAALREQLMALRADQLLAASLVRDLAALNLRPAESPDALQRYVAVEPTALREATANAAALAYVVRIDGALKVVSPVELAALRGGPARDDLLVGYFVDARAVAVLADSGLRLKDGSGTGPQSWIGYTGGNNQATAQGSAVMAGLNNTASGPVSAVISGAGNVASGQGALIGGGDLHQAQGNYSVIVGGYGNRTTASDAVIVGGAFNENGGQRSLLGAGARNRIAPEASYSFIGGGGRDTDVGTGAAGTNAKDNVAFSKWTFIGGGSGNRAGVSGQATANAHAAVVGGSGNTASGALSLVGGGSGNTASGSGSFVGGGDGNTAVGTQSAVVAGSFNSASFSGAAVLGGSRNHAGAINAMVGAGSGNSASGEASVVVGGGRDVPASTGGAGSDPKDNVAGAKWSFIGGGMGNRVEINGQHASVVGGQRNAVTAQHAFVGGGGCNLASGMNSVVVGGGQQSTTVLCTDGNSALAQLSTVVGGLDNTAGGFASAIVGGYKHGVGGQYATIGGGYNHSANGDYSFVGGGYFNAALGLSSTVVGGRDGAAVGDFSTVVGGRGNRASGAYSVAMGRRAKGQSADASPVIHDGVFVFADSLDADFNSRGDNTFNIRARGGVHVSDATSLFMGASPRQMINLSGTTFGIGVQAGALYQRTDLRYLWFKGGAHSDTANDPGVGGEVLAVLHAGTNNTPVTGTLRVNTLEAATVNAATFNNTSDRAAKTGFAAIEPKAILAKVLSLPISSWSFRGEGESAARHIGPMAQDFRRLFGLGRDDRTIATVDADGVALAAIQGLNAKLEAEKSALVESNRRLERELATLRAQQQQLIERLDRMTARLAR